ncbi:MAG TPA: hypothetical protein VFX03_10750, partial [Thermomicrobiales bacterium]|nr:hypothetical protein [Thermomicrobiales bacterium]
MPDDLMIADVAYDWTIYYGGSMPFGLLGTFGSWTTENYGADSILDGGPVAVGDIPGFLPFYDLVRAPSVLVPTAPLPGIYQNAMHFGGANASLLDPTKTPGAIGIGGYSQSTVPTSQFAQQLASGASTANQSATPSTFGALEMLSDPSGGGSKAPPPSETPPPPDPGWMEPAPGSGDPTIIDAGNGYKLVAFFVPADPAKEQKVENDRATEQAGQPGEVQEPANGDERPHQAGYFVIALAAPPASERLRYGPDPNSPFTLPASSGDLAERYLVNEML